MLWWVGLDLGAAVVARLTMMPPEPFMEGWPLVFCCGMLFSGLSCTGQPGVPADQQGCIGGQLQG
jgi:hypothetical protein